MAPVECHTEWPTRPVPAPGRPRSGVAAPLRGPTRHGMDNPLGAARSGRARLAELWSLIHEDWETHFRDWTKPGFRAMAMYRFGRWHLEIGNPLLRRLAGRIYKILHRYVRNQYGIELRCSANVGRRLLLAHQGAIVIHSWAEIGDDCTIFQGVTLGSRNEEEFSPEKAPKLGNGVRVGAGAIVIGKVTIGDGSHIGPNTVVFTNVPAGATVFTPPPRFVFPPDRRDEKGRP